MTQTAALDMGVIRDACDVSDFEWPGFPSDPAGILEAPWPAGSDRTDDG
jgi:hypothetical protein